MPALFPTALVLFASLNAVTCLTKIVHTNDDGWAVANIRAQDTALIRAGFDVVLSAPAENESGTGSSDAPATVLGADGCEFDSCPADAPAIGFNASNPRLNYVNSFPVDAVRFGIQTVAPKFFHSRPDFVVSGPNVGNNLQGDVVNSGTVGAAVEAAKEGIPSVAFSAATAQQISFTTLETPSNFTTAALVYGAVGVRFVKALLGSPLENLFLPILPRNVTLNVNHPATTSGCTDPERFKFVLTRINPANATTPPDVRTCGSARLPTEITTINATTCTSTVSVMDALTKADADAATQAFVLDRLRFFLSCP